MEMRSCGIGHPALRRGGGGRRDGWSEDRGYIHAIQPEPEGEQETSSSGAHSMAMRSRATLVSEPTQEKNSDLLAKSDLGLRRRVHASAREELGQQQGEIPGPA